MENNNLISPKIVVSQNTATMFFHNERSYLNPQFSYNTTIVELKPFKKSNHNSTINNYDSLMGSNKYLTDSASFDLLKKNISSNNSTTASSSTVYSSKFDELMFNKIMKQKKFLINKNMRFYQPVKDAEMLVHLDLLRSKLNADKFSAGVSTNGQYYGLSRGKTNYVDNNDNDSAKIMNLKNPRNSLVFPNSVTSNSFKNSDTNEPNTAENSPTIANGGNFPFEINNQESEFTDEEKNSIHNYRYLFKNEEFHEPSSDSSKLSNNRNSPLQDKISSNQKLNKSDNLKSSNNQNKQDDDFEKLKKYSKINKKQRQYDQTNSFTNDKIKEDLKRNLKSNNNTNTQINSRISRQNTFANDYHNFIKESTFISHSTNMNMNSNSSLIMGRNAITTSMERLKLKTANANLNVKKKNFDHVVRKSSKYRLDNIYKPLEHTHLVDILKNDSKLIDSNYSTRTTSETRIHSNNSIELVDNNGAIRPISNKKLHGDINAYICQDPTCEYKRYIENLNLKTKKEYPNERFQRIKNKKVEPIPNIINDIPSTLNTMSQIGVPTNVERLLTKGLTEFYTKYSHGRLVDLN
jgi:hypothetical protein